MTEPDNRLKEANVIICAIYPEAIVGFIAENVDFFNESVLLTDVAGIKNDMISRGQELLKGGMEFISGHPMAGRQGSGLGMSDAHIFQNANYIIVPEKHNTQAAISWLEQFALALGCKHTVQVTPAQHDATIAYTSNLPHVTAVALMDSASFDDKTKYFVAGSFRDGTRVADINPELWCNLFLANREKVADEIDKYMEQLVLWRDALRSDDGEKLKELMRKAEAPRQIGNLWMMLGKFCSPARHRASILSISPMMTSGKFLPRNSLYPKYRHVCSFMVAVLPNL